MKVMRVDMIVYSRYGHDIKSHLKDVFFERNIVHYPLKIEIKSTDKSTDQNILLKKSTTPKMALDYFDGLNDRRTLIEKEIETTETLLKDLKKELETVK